MARWIRTLQNRVHDFSKLGFVHTQFWNKHPALFMGLFFLFGACSCLKSCFFLLLAVVVLLPITCSPSEWRYRAHKSSLAAALLLLGFLHATSFKEKIPSSLDKVSGQAIFAPSLVKVHHSPFYKSYVYKGTLTYFEGENGIVLKDIPCSVFSPLATKTPKASSHFFLHGRLSASAGNVRFAPDEKPWRPIEHTHTFADWRFRSKQKLHCYLKKHIKDPKALSFLYALCSGDIEERMLRHEFARLGLQHILAISGFHFALIASFCGFFLNKILPCKIAYPLLVTFLTFYFFFLGSSPSVLRAWSAIVIWIVAKLFGYRTSALNALGAGLLIELLYDPLAILELGFQLSFLSTAAILLLIPISTHWITFLLPKRQLDDLKDFSPLDKAGYVVCCLLRPALSLNIAVHLTSVPVCLFCFQKFPLLSLAYNLFFPFWCGLSLLFLLLASLTSLFLPPLGDFLHCCNEMFTKGLLQLTSSPPAFLDVWIRAPSLNIHVLGVYLACLLSAGIIVTEKEKNPWQLI